MILVTRKFDDFSRILTANGFEIENLPLIETALIDDLSDFDNCLDDLKTYDGVFITSQNAARIFAGKLRERNVDFGGRVYVLGRQSFDILKAANLEIIFDETANTAREMLEKIAPEGLRGKKFLFVRGEKSLRVVPDFLTKFATVDEAVVYATRDIKIGIDEIKNLRERFTRGEIAAACFFSPSQAESFISQIGAQSLHQTVIATIGKTTAEYFERQNLRVGLVSTRSNAETFAAELIDFLEGY